MGNKYKTPKNQILVEAKQNKLHAMPEKISGGGRGLSI